MKKFFITAFLAATMTLSAQTEKKEVTLSIRHYELYSILKKSAVFNAFPKIPEKVTEVYECGKLRYTLAETDYYTLNIMPDNEFVFYIKKLAAGSTDRTYHIIFPQDKLYGYQLVNFADHSSISVYQNGKLLNETTIKK